MISPLALALASLACAGVTDVVFKMYSRDPDALRGVYVVGIGIVWSAIQLCLVMLGGLHIDGATVAFGLGGGLLVACSNSLLIESLAHIDVSLGSTIYRLNTIALVVMAVLLLDERLTPLKVAGIGLGVTAILLLWNVQHRHERARRIFVAFFSVAVVASLLRASFGVLSKFAVAHAVDPRTMLLFNAPVWVVVGAIYARARGERMQMTARSCMFAAISATLICGVANFLVLALEQGEASIVGPIANMSFIVAVVLSTSFGMERLTARKIAAVLLAIGAIAVLAKA